MNVIICNHPCIQHKLTILRDVRTGSKQFRELIEEIAMLMCYEALRDLPLEQVPVTTPLCSTTGSSLAGRKLAVVPILRAGLGMVGGILALVPSARVGHIGLYRNHDTLQPQEYYCKLPEKLDERTVILLDPMLATGGSAVAAVDFIKQKGCRDIRFMSIIAAPQGITRLATAHPDIAIYCGHVDEGLNEKR